MGFRRTRSIAKLALCGFLAILALLVLVAFGSMAEIALYARLTSEGPADAAIVLGAAVYTDRPSPVFEERIRHGVNLYEEGHVKRLVMTGGLGAGDRLAEAEVAQRWSLERGVPPEVILLEENSRSTQENLAFALPILQQHGLRRVLIVSDPLHMRRAMAIAHRLGIEAEPSPTPTSRYTGWKSQGAFLAAEAYYLTRCRVAGYC